MYRRPSDAPARRVVLAATGIAITAVTVGSGLLPGSGGVAWAETEEISDGSSVTAPNKVKVGGSIKITGEGWTTPAGGGSVIAVKLDDGDVKATQSVTNPATDNPVSDQYIVAAVQAKANGKFSVSVPVPEAKGWTAGSRHTVRLLSGRLLSDDATRSVALTFDLTGDTSEPSPSPTEESKEKKAESPTPTASASSAAGKSSSAKGAAPPADPSRSPSSGPIGGQTTSSPSASSRPSASPAPTASSGPAANPQRSAGNQGSSPNRAADRPGSRGAEPEADAECGDPAVALSAKTTTRGLAVADLGGTLTLTGTGFCERSGGGSLIAVQIDDGRLVRRDSTVSVDRSVWQVIEAEADGTFSVSVRVPESHQTDPTFTQGLHRLRLLTGTLRPTDSRRSVRTAEFVIAPGNNAGVLPEPTAAPRPVDPAVALVGAKAGAVTVARSGSTVRVVVPELQPGDWVFPYAFGSRTDTTSAEPVTWLQLDADRSVTLDADDVIVAGATGSRVSLQARDGTLVGWAPVVASSDSSGAGSAALSIDESPGSDADAGHSPRPLVLIAGGVAFLLGLGWLALARGRRQRAARAFYDW